MKYFLTQKRQLVPCTILSENSHRRIIEADAGDGVRKFTVHPEGVAWGNSYPRIFDLDREPLGVFTHKGRSLAVAGSGDPLVPDENRSFRFQDQTAHIIDCIHSREHVLLAGPTGVGKSATVDQLAARIGHPVMRINFNGDTRMSDFIGKVSVVAGETRWVDGVLPKAMRLGYWLILDEIDFAEPAVLSLLHPVLESKPVLVLKENDGEVIRPHPDFRVFGTANSIGAMQDRSQAYAGTTPMNEAFMDRWHVIHLENMPKPEELRVVRSMYPGLRGPWAKGIVEFAEAARGPKGDELGFDSFSTRRVLQWAAKATLHRDPLVGAKLAWLDKMPKSSHPVIEKTLAMYFSTREKKPKKPKKAK